VIDDFLYKSNRSHDMIRFVNIFFLYHL